MRTATRVEAHPVHYAPPYASQADLSYPPQQGFAPPYGAPPQGYTPYGGPPQGYAPPAGAPPAQHASSDGLPVYGYGAGAGSGTGREDKKDDPFADFEDVPKSGGQEHDVTSRPAPGGRARF